MRKALPKKNPNPTPPPQAPALLHEDPGWQDYYNKLSDEGKWGVWRNYNEQMPGESNHVGEVLVTELAPNQKQFFSFKNQLRSMAFGLVCGGIVVVVTSFTLFNELIITPFVRPGDSIQIPVVDQAGAPVDPSPKLRITKINVDIPVVYGLATTDEKQFELALDGGIVHYPTTSLPGQAGNTVYFGHSSNNIFNPGKYKFAFVLLHELTAADTFYLTYNGKLYTYEVVSKQIVRPTDLSVLGPVAGQVATATLITCDPPGTSMNRLVVVGKQISPDPNASNSDGTPVATTPEVTAPPLSSSLPGNGPGLLTRIWRSVF